MQEDVGNTVQRDTTAATVALVETAAIVGGAIANRPKPVKITVTSPTQTAQQDLSKTRASLKAGIPEEQVRSQIEQGKVFQNLAQKGRGEQYTDAIIQLAQSKNALEVTPKTPKPQVRQAPRKKLS